MNGLQRQRLESLAAERSAAYPADVEGALLHGMRRLRHRTLLTYAAVVGAVVVLASALFVLHPADENVLPGARLSGITIQAGSTSLQPQSSEQLTAEGKYSDGSTRSLTGAVSWASERADVAAVDSNGRVVAAAPGTAAITASQDDVEGRILLTVLDQPSAKLSSIEVNPAAATLQAGQTQKLSVRGIYSDGSTGDLTTSASWRSSDSTVASVDGEGQVTAAAPGATAVTVTQEGLEATAQITVSPVVIGVTVTGITITPDTATLQAGQKQQFKANFTLSDGSTRPAPTPSWTTSNTKVVQIDGAGLATAVNSGPSTATATISAAQDGFTGTATVTVSAPVVITGITITPATATLQAGQKQQFTADFTFSDGSARAATAATWATSDANVVEIDQGTGMARALATGTTDKTATVTVKQDGISGTAAVKVLASDQVG
ncbi:MAG: Ig-like domain-containing protein [Actinomycetota bacterium]|nr:Ig-like domain-containing protein [Actinomycetota bacterium]